MNATETQQKAGVEDPMVREMLDAGVFYGRKKSRTHPRMKPRVLHNRNGLEIINLHKTAEDLQQALPFLEEKAKQSALFILLGTQAAFADLVGQTAQELDIPVVTRRWLGGSLTNFAMISKRVEYFKKLKSDLASGALVEKYTKKERVDMEHEVEKLQELLGGLEKLPKVPDVMIVIDPKVHDAAVKEAKLLKIPVVALMNIDSDPDVATYPIVGNNKSRQSVAWFLEKMKNAILEGKKHAPVPGVAKPAPTTEATPKKSAIEGATA